jgi:hypothetical protein
MNTNQKICRQILDTLTFETIRDCFVDQALVAAEKGQTEGPSYEQMLAYAKVCREYVVAVFTQPDLRVWAMSEFLLELQELYNPQRATFMHALTFFERQGCH